MIKKDKVLIIGNGGREHALGWKLRQSPQVGGLFFAPGNGGTADLGRNLEIGIEEMEKLVSFAYQEKIDLTIVGPEAPLVEGIVDKFNEAGLMAFGPSKMAARLEGSKAWASNFMKKNKIPCPDFRVFERAGEAKEFLKKCLWGKVVIKADGLAGGKGVLIPHSRKEAERAIETIMVERKFGEAGNKIVIQEKVEGQEVSILAFSDGNTILSMPGCQDHKRVSDGDKGLNTGGMGAYAPTKWVDEEMKKEIMIKIFEPTINGIKEEGSIYVGVLYAGLMLTKRGPVVLEYNVRFGDPETQVLMMMFKSDLYKTMKACVAGRLKEESLDFYEGGVASVVMVSEGYPKEYENGKLIKGLDGKEEGVEIFQAGTVKKDGATYTNGGRVMAVTARGKGVEEAIKNSYGAISKMGISFEGMDYRKDIGLHRKEELARPGGRIDVGYEIKDARAEVAKESFNNLEIREKVKAVKIVDSYTIDVDLNEKEMEKVAEALHNPVIMEASVNKYQAPKSYDWVVEVGFLPGVTDNVGTTAEEIIEDSLQIDLGQGKRVFSSQTYFIEGKLSREDIQKIADSLYNPLIQRVKIESREEFSKQKGVRITIPRVRLEEGAKVDEVNLDLTDEELTKLGKMGIENEDRSRRGPLALRLEYMKTIRDYFAKMGRKATDIELESIAQTWSEHCKHTIFADPIDEISDGIFKHYIRKTTREIMAEKGREDFCVSVFVDNAGAIAFDEKWLVTDKVETHNSPSALDPFGGSITGIVGVNRDAMGFGLGAKPIINRYGFCFADPEDKTNLYKGENFGQKMLTAKQIMEGVIKGVNVGGNCSGIPTTQGFVLFDKSYRGKPLVFVGTVGLIPRKRGRIKLYEKRARNRDYIVVMGGRVGQDGIHGATFSSEVMDKGSPASAVQIGDPITQKKMSDALVKEARDMGLYNSLTDNGAGGLSCSVAEMAKECGGCEVDLEKVPLKYPGLAPWQTWISESQERMTLAVPPEKWKRLADLFRRRGVEVTKIGRFNESGKCVVRYKKKKIMEVEMEFLHDGMPHNKLQTKIVKRKYAEPKRKKGKNENENLLKMLNRLNLASFAFISQQYDHEVQAGSVIKPLTGQGRVNSEATVIRPVPESHKGVVLSQGINPVYGRIDCYWMAGAAIDSAIRKAVAAGATMDKLALLDNFCWCSSDEPERLGQLKEAARGCYDFARQFGTPFVSGKDSMFNDFKGYNDKGEKVKISIDPTLLISSIAVIDEVDKAVSMDIKMEGDVIYVLGETFEELGGSEYFCMLSGDGEDIGSKVPKVDAVKNRKLYEALSGAIEKGLVASSMAIERGGLGVGLAKMAMAGKLGVELSLDKLGEKVEGEALLYSESTGRIVVSVNPKKAKKFEETMKGCFWVKAGGVVEEKRLVIRNGKNETVINLEVESMLKSYRERLAKY